MALTDDESAVLRTIAAQLSRDDPRLASSLRAFTETRGSLWGVWLGLLAVVAVLLGLAVWMADPAPLVLSAGLVAAVPPLALFVRRRGWW